MASLHGQAGTVTGSPKCPRCGKPVTGAADDLGFLKCEGCGARLRKAPTIKLTIQSPTATSTSAPVPASAAPPPTLSGNRDTDSTDSLLARLERVDPSVTLPPGAQSDQLLRAAGFGPPQAPAKNEGTDELRRNLQAIQKELTSLKQSHQELAAVVAKMEGPKRSTSTVPPAASAARAKAPPPGFRPMLIVDDDAALAEETRSVCEKLGFAPMVVNAVRAALDAMGRERPVLLILEPLLAGELSGKDLVNYVKSTMEWIEIPILIHTRAAIVNHEQARTDYGADDYVIKGKGSIDLLAKKIARLTA